MKYLFGLRMLACLSACVLLRVESSCIDTPKPSPQAIDEIGLAPGARESTATIGGLPRVDASKMGSFKVEDLPKGPNGEYMVAIINDQPVYWPRLKMEIEILSPKARAPAEMMEESMFNAFAKVAMEPLITKILHEQYAVENKLSVTESEVRALYAKSFARTLSPETRRQAAINYLLAEKVARHLGNEATSDTIDINTMNHYITSENIEVSQTVELRAAHIVFRAKSDMGDSITTETQARAEDLLERLNVGEITFDEAVTKYSQDQFTRDRKGDLGYFTSGKMYEEFDKAIFDKGPETTATLVRTPVGWHLVRITERNTDNRRSLYNDYRKRTAVQTGNKQLKDRAKIERLF